MKIILIEIENIKGISNLKLDSQLSPSKVNIFVAPNGFGKTSFGTGFKY
jgi:AAA15 family ATPase/GTPase